MKRKKKKKSGWLGVKSGAWRMLSVAVLAVVCLGAGQARAVAHEWNVVLNVEKSGFLDSSATSSNLSLSILLYQTNSSTAKKTTVAFLRETVKVADISSSGGFSVGVVFTIPEGFDTTAGAMSFEIVGYQVKQSGSATKGTWTSATTNTWTPEALQGLLTSDPASSSGALEAAVYLVSNTGTSVQAIPEPSGAMVVAFLASALALKRRRQSR